ncbi:MAG: Crp/Fnr family transcriptional regulator [Anaerolineae bacterium]
MTSIDRKIGYLKTIDIFQDLSKQDMLAMDRTITMSTCKAGKVFYRPDDTAQVLFILKKGRVQFYKISPEGKKLVVSTIEPGTVFGEMSILGQGLYNTFAEALDNCLLCVMSRHDVERLILDKPQVGLRIMQVLSERLQESETRQEELAFRTIPGRLATLLLKLHREAGPTITGYTHQDLADTVGTYRETVTQTLNEFKSAGIIGIGRKRIDILDSNKLQEKAEA